MKKATKAKAPKKTGKLKQVDTLELNKVIAGGYFDPANNRSMD